MKKNIFLITTIVLISVTSVFSQTSIFGGYGTQGANLRLNFDLNKQLFSPNIGAILYGEIGGFQGHTFDVSTINFNNTSYPSKTQLYYAGIGLSGSFDSKTFIFQPYLGLRYNYARFVDQALFDAIGESKLIRYHNGQQVGPKVENAYGNAITFDVGTRIGVKLTDRLSLVASVGISPVKFSTTKTMFGKYWGQAPYPNSYYIELPIYRIEGGLSYDF